MRGLFAASHLAAGLRRLPRCAHRAAASSSQSDQARAAMKDVQELTGVAFGGLADLSPSKRSAYNSMLVGALESGKVTAEMRAQWHAVCAGGFEASRMEMIMRHEIGGHQLRAMLSRDGNFMNNQTTTGDEVSEANMCDVAVDKLRPISIADLEVNHVHVGCVLWVTLAVAATKFTAVSAVVDDDFGGSTMLYMYNVVRADASLDDVAAKFPSGLRLAVKQPYYKVMGQGNRSLRVDNPCNVAWADEVDPRVVANADTAAAAGNYVGPVKVALIEGRMRGLVTTRAVRRGELLFRERAIVSVDVTAQGRLMVAGDGKSYSTGSNADLVSALVSRLAGDPILRARVACLYYGEPRSDVPDMALFEDDAAPPRDVPQISAGRAARVIFSNSFESLSGSAHNGSALFVLTSFMNHAPNHNTARDVADHTMTVVARGDMAAGSELTTYYFPDDDGTRTAALAKKRAHYGIPEPDSRPEPTRAAPTVGAAPQPVVPRADQLFTSPPGSKAPPQSNSSSKAKKKKR